MKSYIKIYGPPLLKTIKALEQIAVKLPDVCIMNYYIEEQVRLGTNPERTREYFDNYDDIDAIRCSNIISKAVYSLGEYDFFFEWFTAPTTEQVLTLIQHIEEALSEIDVRYTITTK